MKITKFYTKVLSLLIVFILSGCSTLFAPPAGTHYKIKYEGAEIEVDDWTDREGVEFEYTKGGTKIILRKESVDTATPAAALNQTQAENMGKAITLAVEALKK